MNSVTATGSSAISLFQAEPIPKDSPTSVKSEDAPNGSEVKFSVLGQLLSASKEKAAKQAGSNDDIENSNLPKTIKDLLKRIRELQEQIREQQQKQAQIMADQSLSPEDKATQLRQVQAIIRSLNGALATAMSSLNDAMQEESLSKDQQTAVVSLLAM